MSLESDTPAPVRARIERQQHGWLIRLKRAAHVPPSTALGCVPFDLGQSKGELGPPAPGVTARIFGHHVEVVFAYRRLPSADTCRPATVDVVVYSGVQASGSYDNGGAVNHFLVNAPRGRVISDLPWNGAPPYHLLVSSTTLAGRRGPTVELPLSCPEPGARSRAASPATDPHSTIGRCPNPSSV
jgi:hypothetical protein